MYFNFDESIFFKEFDEKKVLKEKINNLLEILSEEDLCYFLEILHYTMRT